MKHSCDVKKEKDKEKEDIYTRLVKLEEDNKALKKNNENLQKQLTHIKKNIGNDHKTVNNNNNNMTNNGNIIVTNINLVGYGQEDISKINKSDILKALQNGFNSSIKLTETLHFDPNHPEHHNVYITNVKDKYAMMFDGKDWNLTTKEDLINKIYDDKKNYIEENMDEYIGSMSISRKRALERWLETDDTDDRILQIKEQIKLLLYNKREVPLKTNAMIKDATSQHEKLKKTAGKRQHKSQKIHDED
jgi:hypothetical protein